MIHIFCQFLFNTSSYFWYHGSYSYFTHTPIKLDGDIYYDQKLLLISKIDLYLESVMHSLIIFCIFQSFIIPSRVCLNGSLVIFYLLKKIKSIW